MSQTPPPPPGSSSQSTGAPQRANTPAARPGGSSQPSTPPPDNRKATRNVIIILGVIIVALAALLVYQNIQKGKATDERDELAESNDNLTAEIDELQREYNEIKAQLEEANENEFELKEENERLLSELNALRSRINGEIRRAQGQTAEVEKLQKLLEEANYLSQTYAKKIQELEAVTQEQAGTINQLEGDVNQLEETRERLQGDVADRDAKIQVAAILKAADFNVTGYRKDSPTRGPILKARQARDKLNVCFKVLENNVAPTGTQEFFLVIKDPAGNVLQNMNATSGYFNANGKQMVYSSKAKANYNGERTKVCLDYLVPEKFDFEDGKHIIEAYTDGRLVGSGDFLIK